MNHRGCGNRRGVTLAEVILLICLIVVAIGLLLPALQQVRETTVRHMEAMNLQQIGIAMNNYAASNLNQLPPIDVHNAPLIFIGQKGGTPMKAGIPSSAPMFRGGFLSFMEGNTKSLQSPLDLNLANAGLVNGEPAPCSYSIPAFWSTITQTGILTIPASFPHGTSQCIGAAEMTTQGISYAGIVPFSLAPFTSAVANTPSTTATNFFPSGCLVVMIDGSVRNMSHRDNSSGEFLLAQQPNFISLPGPPEW